MMSVSQKSVVVTYDVDMVEYDGQATLRLKLKMKEKVQTKEMDFHNEKTIYYYGRDFENGDNLHVLLNEGKKAFDNKFCQFTFVDWQPAASIAVLR